jgi:hypothetical protein
MPAGNKKTYQTINDIVDGVCLDLGEGSNRKEQYFHWAIKHVNRWHMDQAREIKTVKLKMTQWKAIVMPDDCIDWIKVGIQDGNVIKTFVHTRDIALCNEVDSTGVKVYNEDPAAVSDIPTDSALNWTFYNYTQNGEDPGRLYGLGMKDNGFGYFTENRNSDTCEIQFRTNVDAGSNIYLEYLATGFNPCGETLIHPYATELVALGIHHERLKHNSNVSRILVKEAKEEMNEEFNRVQDRMWDYNVEEILEWISNGQSMSPKV